MKPSLAFQLSSPASFRVVGFERDKRAARFNAGGRTKRLIELAGLVNRGR